MPDTWIIDCVRTPRGRGKKETGALREIHPQELFAQALNALVARNGFDPRDVEDVVVGTVTEVGEQGGCIARMSVLAAGWPVEATGVSLNRFCGAHCVIGLPAASYSVSCWFCPALTTRLRLSWPS